MVYCKWIFVAPASAVQLQPDATHCGGARREMRNSTIVVLLLALATVSACTHAGSVKVKAAYDVYSNYEDKVPGRWAFSSNGSDFVTDNVEMDSFHCSAHNFPLDAKQAFETSALQTFTNLVEEIDLVKNPISAAKLTASGFKGQVIVNSKDMKADIGFIPGFFMATAKSNVDLTATMQVIGPSGQLIGTTTSDDGKAKSEAGFVCEGGSEAISDAASEAIQRTLGRLGERFSSSDRVRFSSSGRVR